MEFDLTFMPDMHILSVSRACASRFIVVEPRSSKMRAHKLFSEALAVKTVPFDDCMLVISLG